MPSSTPIELFVGLGNPGPEYEQTRHNAGFWFIDNLAHRLNIRMAVERGFNAEFGRGKVNGRDVFLVKPLTYMNRSGQSVSAVMRFYKLTAAQLLVIHDELDLLPGTVKMKKGGGNGGHNGLKDIQAHLNTPDYWRLRLGIGHPRTLALQQEVVDFVLHRPSREHLTQIEGVIDRALDVMPDAMAGEVDRAVMKLHSAA
ncbi:aminoacyl-tRNA hydrolase [Piscinibacterium candidicorallinum]|jgi:PTH1 family peptidyl-tRNA hydrolase|uniref:Peptidyl-tRNA hydrolase n=1 Tax=Piscinibacterium candidicorallinum TaxID=1793872 RepID=A0ABV7HBU8_9BURK